MSALRLAIMEIADEFAALARTTCRSCHGEIAHCEIKMHDGQCMSCHNA